MTSAGYRRHEKPSVAYDSQQRGVTIQPAWTVASVLVGVAVFVRIFVPGNLLDLFYDYDQLLGGNPLLKIHPGTYGLVLVAGVLTLTRRPNAASMVYIRCAAWLGGITTICFVSAIAQGNVGSLGFRVDAEFAAVAALYCLGLLDESEREKLLVAITAGMLLNEVISFGEAITHSRLLPYKFDFSSGEIVFRPTGLLNHPLINGLYSCTMIPLVTQLRASPTVRFFLMGVFAVGTFAAESRFATIVSVPTLAVMFFYMAQASRNSGLTTSNLRYLQIVLGAVFMPIFVLLIAFGGFGQRIASGLFDQSSLARVDAYSLLAYLTPHELMSGITPQRLLIFTAMRQDLIIESPVVMFIFALGLPVAVALMCSIVGILFMLARRAGFAMIVTAVVFFVVAAANNGLASKVPELTFAIVAIASCRGRVEIPQSPPLPA